MQMTEEHRHSWLDRPVFEWVKINWEILLFAAIVLLAIASRFYKLEPRVMSHDENSHVYYSWKLFKGQGFAHDPLMHGPFQFHIVALSYFLFGDNDFTARIPAVLFSIATVWFIWAYRRYLGRTGALIAALLMLISPYILFYGRYVRNEAFVALYGVVMLWSILRYFETGRARYLYYLTTVVVLHLVTKETSFIYIAEALVFLLIILIQRISFASWEDPSKRRIFAYSVLGGVFLLALALGTFMVLRNTAAVPQPGVEAPVPAAGSTSPVLPLVLGGAGLAALLVAMVVGLRWYGLRRIREERSFDMLMLLGTLVLPQLSAFPVFLAGWNIPTNASEVLALTTENIMQLGAFLIPLLALSVILGLWWNRREWLINAAIFYAIFVVFQTTVFTNGAGFFTGIIGSLGYWLKQQDVNRGSQPWYYYALVQMPVYEFLPMLGTWLAFGLTAMGVRLVPARLMSESEGEDPGGTQAIEAGRLTDAPSNEPRLEVPPTQFLLLFWALTSLVAFSYAGEKMPWLTVHITLPAILNAGWAIGYLIDTTNWRSFWDRRGWLALIIVPVFLASLAALSGSLMGTHIPFQGQTLDQLRDTSTFLLALFGVLVSGTALFFLFKQWSLGQVSRIITLFILGFLAILTARTAFASSYINYDRANELLVYAHSAEGVKQALSQIEDISRRTTNGLDMVVAFDNETSYPYWWYLRNYPNQRFFGAEPSRTLRDAPAILVGDANYGKIEPVVGQAYYKFDYIRLWWPNQDYFDLTWDRIWNALTDPLMREAIFYIWLDRDYSRYGKLVGPDKGREVNLTTWSPSAHMRLYLRKDLAAQIWKYGVAPSVEATVADPYEKNQLVVQADNLIGGPDGKNGIFQRPRGIAVAPDGSLYVADTESHRIQHITPDGEVLETWGSFGDVATGQAPGGVFNQPWGIAVSPDSFVYVADTWNHRIQKFNSKGEFVKMWGYFGQAEKPDAFWGPRSVAVDDQGNVFVTDTGNKRVVIFDKDGSYITQFGSAGMDVGQFDEPVGVAVDANGEVYVADTWNQRIQVFKPTQDGEYLPDRNWEMAAWYGQSLDNKPYLALDGKGNLYMTDPEGFRVLQFKTNGEFVRYWGDAGATPETFNLPTGISVDADGGVWITDAGNNRLMHFTLPR